MNEGQHLEQKLPISEATKKRNPHLFGVGAVEAHRSERASLQTLVRSLQKPKSRKDRVEVRIALIQFRRRLLDGHDAVAYSCKPLTDAIAQTLGVDDADKRLHWQYEQVLTKGAEGVAVKLDVKEL